MYNWWVDAEARETAEGLCEIVGAFTQWARCQGGEFSPTAAAILVRLARKGPARASVLAAHVRVALPTMTSLLGRLSAQGSCDASLIRSTAAQWS